MTAAELEAHGVAKIFSPDDGARLGLKGMAAEMCALAREAARPQGEGPEALLDGDRLDLARAITSIEAEELHERVATAIRAARAPTSPAGKESARGWKSQTGATT